MRQDLKGLYILSVTTHKIGDQYIVLVLVDGDWDRDRSLSVDHGDEQREGMDTE